MELRDSGRGRLKDLADVAGHKVAETAKAATQRAVDMARDAEEAAGEAAGSAAQFADAAGRMLLDRVGDLKSAAFDNVEKIGAHNLDPYEEAICEYNRAFTAMSDKGIAVLRQRERSTDLIELVERLGSEILAVFPIDAPGVSADTVSAGDGVAMMAGSESRTSFTARLDAGTPAAPGRPISLHVNPASIHLFDPATGAALRQDAP